MTGRHKLPKYSWLDESECFDSAVIETGWKAIIERLLVDIDVVLTGTSAVLYVQQVKEKLGSLRFYRRFQNASDDQIATVEALVDAAYDESIRTCIVCGAPGILQNCDGLIEPFCGQHCRKDLRW